MAVAILMPAPGVLQIMVPVGDVAVLMENTCWFLVLAVVVPAVARLGVVPAAGFVPASVEAAGFLMLASMSCARRFMVMP